MRWLRQRWLRVREGRERGEALIVFVLVMVIPMLAVIGLVVDGGAKLAATNHAGAVAAQAARTAGQQLDAGALMQGFMPAADVLDATAAAQAVLSDQGVVGDVDVDGETITVTVVASSDTFFLRLFGVETVQGYGSATVRLATEVEP